MKQKTKEALFFVRKVKKNKYPSEHAEKTAEILFAVVHVPERTVAPPEEANYILYSGNKNKRHKMKINTVTYATYLDGKALKVDKRTIAACVPNFEEVTGDELKAMYEKCSPAFKKRFPLD